MPKNDRRQEAPRVTGSSPCSGAESKDTARTAILSARVARHRLGGKGPGRQDSAARAFAKPSGPALMTPRRLAILATLCAIVLAVAGAAPASVSVGQLGRIDHVADGDTVDLSNGARVRLVQIDTPEVYFRPECYGKQASAITKRLLPPGTLVRLTREPATDSADSYGRLLRYVTRVRGHLNINIHLVAVGAAAPYFYRGRRGRYAARLARLALRARRNHLGLWGRCPGTPYDPYRGVSTGPPR
jgi:micrococcal nuclease